MHTKRIIPCLDVNNGRVVKGVNFVSLRDAGDPVEIAKAYDKAGADELVFLDGTGMQTHFPVLPKHGYVYYTLLLQSQCLHPLLSDNTNVQNIHRNLPEYL